MTVVSAETRTRTGTPVRDVIVTAPASTEAIVPSV